MPSGAICSRKTSIEFDLIEEAQDGPYFKAVAKMRQAGYGVKYGRWLVTGRPKAILFDLSSVNDKLCKIKYHLWQDHGISTPDNDFLINGVVMFGEMVRVYLAILAELYGSSSSIIAHFHE